MKKKVIVSDRMQRGYVYWRTEPVGRNFAPGFTPDLTPKEMLRLGIFGGKYMTGDVGVLTVADAKSGERVHQERIGGVYTASPVAGDGKVYLSSEDGETIVLAAGRTPTILARNRLNARQLASPAISGGRLFIRSDQALFAIGK